MRASSFLLLLLFLIIPPAARAQRSVTGTVQDESGKPLEGASIVLRLSESGMQRYGASTDASGRFELTDVMSGTYDLQASYVGFSSVSLLIDVRESDLRGLSIQLLQAALPQGPAAPAVAPPAVAEPGR